MIAADLRPRLALSAFVALALALAVPAAASAAGFSLTVEPTGSGTGTWKCEVEGAAAEPCEAEYADGTELTVLPEADPGSEFIEFFGDCGPLACELTMDEDHTATVLFEALQGEEVPLTIEALGAGAGTVECEVETGPEPCLAEYPAGTELIVLATADPGSEFVEFGGDCGPAECELTVDEEHTVSVLFEEEASGELSLTIAKAGTGTGTVECEAQEGPEPCKAKYPEGTELGLIATASAGSTFAGFSAGTGSAAACSTSPCSFTIEANSTVTATFNIAVKPKFKLTVTKSGTGSGTVTSTPAGINCGTGAGCEAEYDEGTEVTLSPAASSGSQFTEWTGACTGSGACKVTMSAAKSVGAVFSPTPRTLTITKAGTGSGEVKCKFNGGSAGACTSPQPNGTAVEVLATANAGSTFAGYSAGTGSAAACSTSPCSFTIEANSTVTATFNIAVKPKFKLTVTKSGTGQGTVTSTPAGINCGSGAGCEAKFDEGTEVTLNQVASAGSEFKEWTGACTGSGACKVTMSAAKSVGAKFNLIPKPKFKLSVSKTGGGTGTVTSSPAGITCGSGTGCEHEYDEGTHVTLTESPGSGSEFGGWQTLQCDESTATTCEITIGSHSEAVGASFIPKAKPKFKLTVTKSGSGSGTVTSTPAGINCGSGAGCEAEYDEGTEVTLSQSAASGSEFKEWTGACTGSGACKVTMSSAKAVGAKFDLKPHLPEFTLAIELSGNGSGLIACNGGACAERYPEGAEVTLSATALPGSVFAGFSGGGCSGTGDCKVTIEAETTIGAKFLAIPFFPPPPPIQKGTALAAAFASYQGDSALIRLLCPQGARCTGALELFAKLQSPAFAHRRHGPAKATLIGTASFDLAPQSQGAVAVKITSARARSILAAGRDLNAQLLGTSVRSRIVRLVAPPRGRHRG